MVDYYFFKVHLLIREYISYKEAIANIYHKSDVSHIVQHFPEALFLIDLDLHGLICNKQAQYHIEKAS